MTRTFTTFLLIPSCEVKPVDSLEGTETELRLKAGLAFYQAGGYDKIIVCGGIYLPPHIQTRPSGALMKEWLVAHGVPATHIIAETKSRDTYENVSGALKLVGHVPDDSITVISHWQHAWRIKFTFVLAHRIKVKFIALHYPVGLKTFLKEWLIFLVHVTDWKGTGFIARWNRGSRTFPKPT